MKFLTYYLMHIKIERKIKGELQHIKKALRKTKSIHFHLRIVYLLNVKYFGYNSKMN